MPLASPLLRRGLKLSHLRLMAELDALGQVGLAAEQIGITQPAASRLLAEVERIAGQPVHERRGGGTVLTPQGLALARRARRVLQEIDEAGREIAETGEGLGGHVRIGSVTGPALELVLPAVRAARLATPGVTVEVDVATSDALASDLLAGRLDLSLSRVPPTLDRNEFDLTLLGSEPVVLLVRQDHPLTLRGDLTPADLLDFDWVMSGPGAILRRTVESRLAELGVAMPRVRLATTSFLLTLALVQQSNAIAPLALAVARQFTTGPGSPYRTLSIDMGIEVEPFGLMTRAGAVLTPAAARMRQLILETARQAG